MRQGLAEDLDSIRVDLPRMQEHDFEVWLERVMDGAVREAGRRELPAQFRSTRRGARHEFVCSRSHLVQHTSRMADAVHTTCVDCA